MLLLRDPRPAAEAGEELGVGIYVWAAIAPILLLIVYTGLPSYFFHPRRLPIERQNRAIALSYYGSGPLAFLPLTVMLAAMPIWMYAEHRHELIAWAVAACLVLANIVACWYSWSCLGRRVLQRPVRRLLMTWVLPILWLVVGGLVLLIPPLVVGVIGIVCFSIRDAG